MRLATPQPPAESSSPTARGLAELRLERRAGRTRLTRVRTRPPLLVQRALHPDGRVPDMAHVFLANPTGGLLAGDCQEVRVDVRHGARAHVTTQSATKIHTMERDKAVQRVVLSVSAGGYLEYLPDPLIPFHGARLEQEASITVEPEGALIWWDVITPGRVAMGESFRYRRVSNRLTVFRHGGRPVYREACDLVPSEGELGGTGILGARRRRGPDDPAARTLGSALVLCGKHDARCILDQIRESLESGHGVQAGASLLPDANGLGVKMIGPDCGEVQRAMQRVWAIARRVLIGAEPPPLRKY